MKYIPFSKFHAYYPYFWLFSSRGFLCLNWCIWKNDKYQHFSTLTTFRVNCHMNYFVPNWFSRLKFVGYNQTNTQTDKPKELNLCHNLKFAILISLQSDSVNLWCFKLRFFLSNRLHSLKYLRSMILSCKDIGNRKSEFVAKTQFLF